MVFTAVGRQSMSSVSSELKRAKWKAYYSINREHLIAKNRAYYQENREKIQEHARVYRQVNREKLQEYDKAYRQANREKIRIKDRAYRQANREEILAHAKIYYQTNREKILARQKEYYRANREKSREYQQAHPEALKRVRLKCKRLALERLGGKCSHCGEMCEAILQINHLHPYWERGKRPQTEMSTNLWRRVKKMEHPEQEYSVLCGGCNWRDWQEHEKLRLGSKSIPTRMWIKKIKDAALRRLTPQGSLLCCSDCGETDFRFLTVNHLCKKWKRGERPRSESDISLWRKILRMQNPERTHNILCKACNWKRYFDGVKVKSL